MKHEYYDSVKEFEISLLKRDKEAIKLEIKDAVDKELFALALNLSRTGLEINKKLKRAYNEYYGKR